MFDVYGANISARSYHNMCIKSGFKQAGSKEYLQEYLQPKIGRNIRTFSFSRRKTANNI